MAIEPEAANQQGDLSALNVGTVVVTDIVIAQSESCPTWCSLDHGGDPPTSHESRSIPIAVGFGDNPLEFLEVRIVQYLDEAASADSLDTDQSQFIEVAHHFRGRYRLISMSCDQAQSLVEALLHCTDAAEQTTGPGR